MSMVRVAADGPLYRVVEDTGLPATVGRKDADDGGFRDVLDAEHLAATINERRTRRAHERAG